MLEWRWATPRWADDPIQRMGMLGQRQAIPRWVKDHVVAKSGIRVED